MVKITWSFLTLDPAESLVIYPVGDNLGNVAQPQGARALRQVATAISTSHQAIAEQTKCVEVCRFVRSISLRLSRFDWNYLSVVKDEAEQICILCQLAGRPEDAIDLKGAHDASLGFPLPVTTGN